MESTLIASGVLIGSFAGAIAYCFALLSCGLLALRMLDLGRAQCAEWPTSCYLGAAFALGSGLLGSTWLVLANLHLFLPPVVFGISLILLALAILFTGPLWAEIRGATISTVKELARDTWPWRIVTLLTLCVIGAYTVAAVHPAIGDSAAFYLPWPRIVAASGYMRPLPGYEDFSDIWTIAEMHTAAVMAVFGDWAARPLPFLHGIVAAALLWGMGRSAGAGTRGCLVAVAMLFTSTNFGLVIWDGKVDLVALPIGLAAMYVASRLQGLTVWRIAITVGLLCGFAVAAKLSYLAPLGGAVLVITLWRLRQLSNVRPAGALGRSAGLLGVVAAATCFSVLPQIAKNWTMSGEPFAPLFYFGTPRIDTAQVYYTAATTTRLLLTYPLALIFGKYWAQYGTLSILFLAFLPLGFIRFTNQQRPSLWLLTLAALFGLLVWITLRPSTFAPRYILCVLVVPFLLAADGAGRASVFAPWPVRTLILLALGFVLVESSLSLLTAVTTAWRYATSADLESYEDDDTFNMARLLNASAPRGSRIALMGYYRYPLRPDLLECSFSQGQLLGLLSLGGQGQMAVAAYLDGADYLVFDLMTHKNYVPADFTDLPAWFHIEQIYRGPRIWIFRLRAGDGGPTRMMDCVRNGRAWVTRTLAAAPAGPTP